MRQEIVAGFFNYYFCFHKTISWKEMVTFNSVNGNGYTYNPAACCGGVNQPLGAVCVEGLMESDSNKNLSKIQSFPILLLCQYCG